MRHLQLQGLVGAGQSGIDDAAGVGMHRDGHLASVADIHDDCPRRFGANVAAGQTDLRSECSLEA